MPPTGIDEAIKVDVPGMEIGTQHKYGLDILLDFKPEDSPMRPETAAAFKKRLANPPPEDLCDRAGLLAGVPLAGLLSKPIKIVQAPRLTMVLYELGGSATRSSSRRADSTARPCSMRWGMRTAISCAWRTMTSSRCFRRTRRTAIVF